MAITNPFRGILPAMQVPYNDDLSVDEGELRRFSKWLAGHQGIDRCGVSEVDDAQLFARASCPHGVAVAQTQRVAVATEPRAQLAAQVAGRTGEQQSLQSQRGERLSKHLRYPFRGSEGVASRFVS